MTDMEKNCLFGKLKKQLEQYEQSQLLSTYQSLNEEEKEQLLLQLDSIDFQTCLDSTCFETMQDDTKEVTEPMQVMQLQEIEKKKHIFYKLGLEEISKGHVAVVLLAGGQGTRLGIKGPKGTLNIGLTRDLYLFEIIVSNLHKTVLEAGRYVDLYIMVNSLNEQETREFFENHDYFGYDPKHIIFFAQRMVPKLLFNGKMILSEKSEVATAPCGNGAWFEALRDNQLDKKMKKEHISWINLLSVDNPLYNIIDCSFLGALITQNAQMGVQVVEKVSPYEKVGVICRKNGRVAVKEYYEMTKEEQESRDDHNELCYKYGVILNYMFHMEELEKVNFSSMPIHYARKKMSYINEAGEKIIPNKENGYIMERLALDMLPFFEHVVAYEVEREKNFAPIKNKTGIDSVESARVLLQQNGYTL